MKTLIEAVETARQAFINSASSHMTGRKHASHPIQQNMAGNIRNIMRTLPNIIDISSNSLHQFFSVENSTFFLNVNSSDKSSYVNKRLAGWASSSPAYLLLDVTQDSDLNARWIHKYTCQSLHEVKIPLNLEVLDQTFNPHPNDKSVYKKYQDSTSASVLEDSKFMKYQSGFLGKLNTSQYYNKIKVPTLNLESKKYMITVSSKKNS